MRFSVLHTVVMGLVMRVRGGDEVNVLHTVVMGLVMNVRGGAEGQCVTHRGDGDGDERQGW